MYAVTKYTHTCTHMHTHTCTCTCKHTCISTHTYTCTCTCTRIHTHVGVHTLITSSSRVLHIIDVQPTCMYIHCLQPTNVQERSDVGIRIPLEVVVENVGSTDIDNARLEIYYPARSPATGQFFFLLPDCSVDLVIVFLSLSALLSSASVHVCMLFLSLPLNMLQL